MKVFFQRCNFLYLSIAGALFFPLFFPVVASAITPVDGNDMNGYCKNIDENNVEQTETCYDYFNRLDEAQKNCGDIDKKEIEKIEECYSYYGLAGTVGDKSETGMNTSDYVLILSFIFFGIGTIGLFVFPERIAKYFLYLLWVNMTVMMVWIVITVFQNNQGIFRIAVLSGFIIAAVLLGIYIAQMMPKWKDWGFVRARNNKERFIQENYQERELNKTLEISRLVSPILITVVSLLPIVFRGQNDILDMIAATAASFVFIFLLGLIFINFVFDRLIRKSVIQ